MRKLRVYGSLLPRPPYIVVTMCHEACLCHTQRHLTIACVSEQILPYWPGVVFMCRVCLVTETNILHVNVPNVVTTELLVLCVVVLSGYRWGSAVALDRVLCSDWEDCACNMLRTSAPWFYIYTCLSYWFCRHFRHARLTARICCGHVFVAVILNRRTAQAKIRYKIVLTNSNGPSSRGKHDCLLVVHRVAYWRWIRVYKWICLLQRNKCPGLQNWIHFYKIDQLRERNVVQRRRISWCATQHRSMSLCVRCRLALFQVVWDSKTYIQF